MFVYILHFDTPLSHAQHYVGMTGNLKQRLAAHAAGSGARLTEVLKDNERPWTLAGLFQTTTTNARRVERELKESKNLARYCDICTPDAPAPPRSKRYPLTEVPFKHRSTDIDPQQHGDVTISVREARDQIDINFAREIQRFHKVELGFLNDTALWVACNEQHMYIASVSETPVAFLIWTNHLRTREVTIHQCATIDAQRLRGIAKAMVNGLAAMNPTSSIWCKVRVDLPANFFWEAIGFNKVRTVTHATSKQQLNQYYRAGILCTTKSSETTEDGGAESDGASSATTPKNSANEAKSSPSHATSQTKTRPA